MMAPLPRPWRAIFALEIPLTVVVVVIWIATPATYLKETLDLTAGPTELLLLRLYAGIVGSLVIGFYTWLLAQKAVHMPTFRAFQVSLGAGDVAIIAASVLAWPPQPTHGMLFLQIGTAAFWGIVRAVFWLRTRGYTRADTT